MAGSYEQDKTGDGPAILADRLAIFPKSAVAHQVSLYKDKLVICPLNGSATSRRNSVNQVPSVIQLRDVTGCHLMKSRADNSTWACFRIYYYPYKRRLLSKKCRQHQTITFVVAGANDFTANKLAASQWKNTIVCLAQRCDVEGQCQGRAGFIPG